MNSDGCPKGRDVTLVLGWSERHKCPSLKGGTLVGAKIHTWQYQSVVCTGHLEEPGTLGSQ